MNELTFAGTNRKIGREHGEALRDEIAQTLEAYMAFWQIPPSSFESRVAGFKQAVDMYAPHLVEEIAGIAEGSNLKESEIWAINCRTELMPSFFSVLECTVLGVRSQMMADNGTTLAQNWDFMNLLRGLTQVVDVSPNNAPRMKMLIEPGMVGKIGMNEYVGVCLNFLPTECHYQKGIPVHVLLRMVLECNSCGDATDVLKLPRASSANYMVGDRFNVIINSETSPELVRSARCSDFITHTNAFTLNGEECYRDEQARAIVRSYVQKGKLSVDDLTAVLHAEGIHAPCSKTRGSIETIHTIVMNISDGKMFVSDGAKDKTYRMYELK